MNTNTETPKPFYKRSLPPIGIVGALLIIAGFWAWPLAVIGAALIVMGFLRK